MLKNKAVLKIDTSVQSAVTVEIGSGSYKDVIVESQKLGSQVLLTTIVKILKKNKIKFSDLISIYVNPGPGSFTGTRVGVTIANTLGFILKIPVNEKKGKIVLPIYEKSKFDK